MGYGASIRESFSLPRGSKYRHQIIETDAVDAAVAKRMTLETIESAANQLNFRQRRCGSWSRVDSDPNRRVRGARGGCRARCWSRSLRKREVRREALERAILAVLNAHGEVVRPGSRNAPLVS